MIGERMKQLRKNKKLTLEQLANDLNKKYPNTMNFNKGKLSKWENGKEEPKLSSIRILADYYGIAIDDFYATKNVNSLNDNKLSIEKIFNKLDGIRKEKVYFFAKKQLEQQNNIVKFPKKIPLVGKVAANPSILEYGDVNVEQGSFEHIPEGADCAILIQGDSMEPLIKDGEIVFYRRQEDIENGEIAIVEINGDGVTCKKVYFNVEEETIILKSINEKYQDREISDEDIRIVGKVLLK